MALFSQNMLELALILAEHDPTYEDFVLKFVEHFFWIAAAVDPIGDHPDEMWDDEDGFFYDVLRLPDGTRHAAQGALARRAAAAVRHDRDRAERARALPAARRERSASSSSATATCSANIADPLRARRRTAGACCRSSTRTSCGGSWPGCSTRSASWARTASARSRAGTSTTRTRSTSHGAELPGAATSRPSRRPAMFGGNSNWRGPVWFPINLLLIRALLAALPLLRRRLQGRVPHRVGHADDAVRGRAGARPPADRALPARRGRHGGRCTAAPRCSRTTRTGATSSCSTSTSTATTAPASAPRTRPDGPAWSRG